MPAGSHTNSFRTERAAAERLNAVPSAKVDADGAIGSGLNRIAPVDEIADADSNNLAVGAHDG